MKDKLIVFDIDGTIWDHNNNRIPSSTKAAIAELQHKGFQVVIATGRGTFEFKNIREELNIHNYVAFNGQLVVFNDEIIYENSISKELCHKLLMGAMERDFPVVFQSEEGMRINVRNHNHVAEALSSLDFGYPDYDAEFYKCTTIYQALLFCEDGEEEKFASKYAKNLRFVRWHQYSVDVLPAGGSKAKGIEVLMNKLGIVRENVYAFGDGLNDREMIQFVGNGIAMGNSVEELKQLAKYVTKNVDEDGIHHGLKWAGLL